MNRDEWWAVLWSAMAFALGIVAFGESRRADHWHEAHAEAWRVIGETAAECRKQGAP